VGNPGQDERDSEMMPNGAPGWSRTGFRDEGEHDSAMKANSFWPIPREAFGFAGVISEGS